MPYLFADILDQTNAADAFGPVSTEQYKVQSSHEVASETPAIAVAGGLVYAVENSADPDFINLILKPNQEELPEVYGFRVEFMVYKRVLKSSILDMTSQEQEKPVLQRGENDLVDHLWEISDHRNQINETNYVPGSNMLGLHLSSTEVPDDKPIDWLFRYDDSFTPIPVDAGNTLGILNQDFEFEIYIHRFIEDHLVLEARNNENIITIDTNDPALKVNHDRERILNYLDPAAFYGMFCNDDSTVIVKNASSSYPYNGLDEIFENVLERFYNKDVLYIDIRNDNFYSYNFYNQFDINGENIQYKFATYNKVSTAYGAGSGSWPIQTIRTVDVQNLDNFTGAKIKLEIELIHYPDSNVAVFYANAERRLRKKPVGLKAIGRVIKKVFRRLVISGNWTTPFQLEVHYYSGNQNCLIATYQRIYYVKTVLDDNSSVNTVKKQGMLDNLFPLIAIPDLRPHESTRLFVTGFERFVFFDHDSNPDIPFSFYGIFKFAYIIEGDDRIILMAFADEVYLAEKRRSANGLLDHISLDSSFTSLPLTGNEVNPVICYQDIMENNNPVKFLRYEPGAFDTREIPTFNLQTNYLAVYLSTDEYDKIQEEADTYNLEKDFHLRFLRCSDSEYTKEIYHFPTAHNDPPRFVNYYKLAPAVKGIDNNGSYTEFVVDFSSLQLNEDSILRTFNKLVYSTPLAGIRENSALKVNVMSNLYFILPDEILVNHPNYSEIIHLKDAIKETYATIPDYVTTLWSKQLHHGLKTAIGILRKSNSTNPPVDQLLPVFSTDELFPDAYESPNFPYFHTYKKSIEVLKDMKAFTGIAIPVPFSSMKKIEIKGFVREVEYTGIYRKSPIDIFNDPNRGSAFNTPKERFQLMDLYMGTGFYDTSYNDFKEVKAKYFSDDLSSYIKRTYHSDLNASYILEPNETAYHEYFDLIYGLDFQGKYRIPSVISRSFYPNLNVRNKINHNLDMDIRFQSGNSDLDALWGKLYNLLFFSISDNIPDEFPPFYFYGNDPGQPQPSTLPTNQLPSPYNVFNPDNFPYIRDYYSNIIGSTFSYRDYLMHIFTIIDRLTFHINYPIDNYEVERKLRELSDSIPSGTADYLKGYYPHVAIAINMDSSGFTSIFNTLSQSNVDKVKKIYYADVIAHELGHTIVAMVRTMQNGLFSEIEKRHLNTSNIADNFPDYPYYFGSGHIRGSVTGNLSCNLGNQVERLQNLKHKVLLSGIHSGTKTLFALREEKRFKAHIYKADSNNLPINNQEPDGYCFNNMDPS